MGRRTQRPTAFRHLVILKMIADALAWCVGIALAVVARYDLAGVAAPQASRWWIVALLAAATQWSAGLILRLYRGRYRYGSFEEVAGLLAVVLLTSGTLLTADELFGDTRLVPLSVIPGAAIVAFTVMTGVRYVWRLTSDRRRRPLADRAIRLLVFGAGDGGAQVVLSMLRTADSPYYPVGFLDDDRTKKYLRINGVPVLGGRERFAEHARRVRAEALLIAIPSATATLVGELSALAEEAGLPVKVLPPARELLDNRVRLGDIRDIDLEDLLGRRQIETDVASIAGYLTGKRVLVTGAGGSIGSELSRQIAQYGPARLLMLDRDESALHAVQLSMTGRALLDSPDLLLADIRDAERIHELFVEHRPEVVFHAAALKHLPLLELHPGEAVKTNVWGSLTVLEAAAAVGVSRLVNISTDKAADPISVLGYSKRITERLTATVAARADGTFLSVRFGNVLGSRGSVITAFKAQVAAGGPVTVTDPVVTRYFMTVEEAVELVIQAGAIGRDAEVLVLDMGDPVRIADVAHRLASQLSKHPDVVFTGLRPGEKLHESLLCSHEIDVRPIHKSIMHVQVPTIARNLVLTLDPHPSRATAGLRTAAMHTADTGSSKRQQQLPACSSSWLDGVQGSGSRDTSPSGGAPTTPVIVIDH